MCFFSWDVPVLLPAPRASVLTYWVPYGDSDSQVVFMFAIHTHLYTMEGMRVFRRHSSIVLSLPCSPAFRLVVSKERHVHNNLYTIHTRSWWIPFLCLFVADVLLNPLYEYSPLCRISGFHFRPSYHQRSVVFFFFFSWWVCEMHFFGDLSFMTS